MYITDFTYDGTTLSSKGCVVCSFNDAGGIETIGNGSVITFSTTPILKGNLHVLADTRYDECLSTTFSICKNPCTHSDMTFSVLEERQIMRWLNRKEFKKLYVNATDYSTIYFEGSFNVSRVESMGKIVGFELTFTSNRPFGVENDKSFTIELESSSATYTLTDTSDEIGYIYPKTFAVILGASGNLVIHNSIEPSRDLRINNCTNGEIINILYPAIMSSVDSHNIANDFNYNYFRIANSEASAANIISASLPCTIALTYNPIRKVGL